MSDLSKRIANLSPEKRALLDKRLNEKKNATSSGKSIPRRKNISPAILSFAQKRLWFLDQYKSGSHLYNISVAFRLLGNLNLTALHNAINHIVSRHEALRTTFTAKNGEPVQVIVLTLKLDLPIIDISDFTEDDRGREIQRLINEEAQKPFDLSCGPLLRTTLLRLKGDEHVFLLTIHQASTVY